MLLLGGKGELGVSFWGAEGGGLEMGTVRKEGVLYFSVKVRLRSQTIMGRLRRSLYLTLVSAYLRGKGGEGAYGWENDGVLVLCRHICSLIRKLEEDSSEATYIKRAG